MLEQMKLSAGLRSNVPRVQPVVGAPVISDSEEYTSINYFNVERPVNGRDVRRILAIGLRRKRCRVERLLVRAKRSNGGLRFICELSGRNGPKPVCSGSFDPGSGDLTFDDSLDILLPPSLRCDPRA